MANPSNINPQSQVRVEEANFDDAAAIAAIGRGTFQASFGHSMGPEDLQAYLDLNYQIEIIEKELSTASNVFMVARQHDESDKVLGFIQLKLGTSESCLPTDVPLIELHRIYMHHQSNGRGTGKHLIDAAHKFALQKNFAGIWLGVWEENQRAQRFYHKNGYERVGHHEFVIGNEVQRDYVLLKKF